jgi:RNA recognition motif-containing protein
VSSTRPSHANDFLVRLYGRDILITLRWIPPRFVPACVSSHSCTLQHQQGRRFQPFAKESAVRIYVGNLSFNTDETQVQQLFAPLGVVDSVRLIRDRDTGQSRGFGFVEMTNDGEGRAACQALDQQELDGRRLTVNEAKPQESRNSGSRPQGNAGGFRRPKHEPRW